MQTPFHMRCTSITCCHYTGQWLLRGTYLSSMWLAEAYVVCEEDFAVTAETPVQIRFLLRCNATPLLTLWDSGCRLVCFCHGSHWACPLLYVSFIRAPMALSAGEAVLWGVFCPTHVQATANFAELSHLSNKALHMLPPLPPPCYHSCNTILKYVPTITRSIYMESLIYFNNIMIQCKSNDTTKSLEIVRCGLLINSWRRARE